MLLVDTNIWLAAADRRSRYHAECVRLIEAHRAALASTVPVISETAWLLLDRDGPAAQQNFVGSVATGEINVIDLAAGDWLRIWQLCGAYSDLGLDIIDASTIAVAERLRIDTIATLDRRDFTVVRPNHVDAFPLLPGPT